MLDVGKLLRKPSVIIRSEVGVCGLAGLILPYLLLLNVVLHGDLSGQSWRQFH